MTTFDAKVLGPSATPSRASWWLSACRFSDAFPKSRPSASQGVQPTGIITVSPVSKEPAPLDTILSRCHPAAKTLLWSSSFGRRGIPGC